MEAPMHALIVEDKPVFSDRWRRFLQHRSFTVAVAVSQTEAFREFRNKTPDLIICDNDIVPCAMYDDIFDGGFFFITKIRAEGFAGRIIFYTRGRQSYFQGETDIIPLNVRYIQKRFKRQSI